MIAQLTSHYTRQAHTHASNIFNFPEDFPSNPMLHLSALRFLKQYGNGSPTEEQLRARGRRLFSVYSQQHNIEGMAEAADILNDEEIFDQLRTAENHTEVDVKAVRDIADKKIVYNDSQNVHNSKINKTVIEATSQLYTMYKHEYEIGNTVDEIFQYKRDCLREIELFLIGKYPSSSLEQTIVKSIRYIRDNVGTFGIGVSLQDALLCLWSWMRAQDSKIHDVLEQRLLQELESAIGKCTTGYLARLINVMQGYTSDEKLCIRISEKDQYSSVIKQYLKNILSECSDEKVIMGMTDLTDDYKQYIKDSIQKRIKDWIKDYGHEIIHHIPSVVNTYAGCVIIEK